MGSQNYFFQSLRDLLSTAGRSMFGDLAYGFTVSAWSGVTWRGHPGLEYTVTAFGTTTTLRYLWEALSDDEFAPIRLALSSPGMTTLATQAIDGSFSPLGGWSDYKEWWQTAYGGATTLALQNLTTAQDISVTYTEFDGDGGIMRSMCGSWTCRSGSECMGFTSSLNSMELTGGSDQDFLEQSPAIAGVGNSSGSAINLRPVVVALEEIAMSRTEISVNNGDAMFSVTGGSRAAGEA